jgi:excisionase family DNA binding protein
MTDTDLSDWLPIADAALIIGVSTRTIERLAHAKQLEQRLRPQAGSPAVAVFNPDDVARIARERRPAPAPFVVPAVGDSSHGNGRARGHLESKLDPSGIQLRPGDDPIRQLFAAALRAVLSPPSPPLAVTVAETSFVTIREASRLTGLTQAYLRRQLEAGTLKAVRDRGWRIRRKDLGAL